MTLDDIKTAFIISLDSGASLPIQFENNSGEQNDIHYQPLFLPAETENIALSFTGVQDFSGIFQVNVNIKIGKAEEGLIAALNELDALFARGTQLTHGATTVQVEKIYTSQGVSNNPWYTTPVSIEFRSIQ